MMSVGLHCRLVGRPGKAAGLRMLLDHMAAKGGAWIATRGQIAAHWAREHPPEARERPSEMTPRAVRGAVRRDRRALALGRRAGVGSWSSAPPTTARRGSRSALARVLRTASEEERLGVLRAHPDLAGKLAAAKRLTPESAAEQASAGLDALTDAERARFEALNAAYVERHGIPFIIAVRDHDKAGILAAFERRLGHDTRRRAGRGAGPGRAHRRPAPEGDPAMTYATPAGGLPPQTALHTGRAVFTEAYAVIPRGCMTDIVTSFLPGWEGDARSG